MCVRVRVRVCVCVCMFMRVCLYEHVAYACCMSVSVRPTLFLPDLDPNQAPVFSALPSDVSVPEDVTPGDTLIQFDVTDTQTFARTLTADSGAALFDFNSASESLVFCYCCCCCYCCFYQISAVPLRVSIKTIASHKAVNCCFASVVVQFF